MISPGRLAFGMQLPIAAQSTVFVQPWETSAGTAEIVRIAESCDRSGISYLAVSDHVCVPRAAAAAMSTVWYDAIATLGFLAGITRNVRLLSYVWVAPYRHPLVTAKAFSTLDALSGGRVIVGVGAGHLEGEFETLGVDFHRRGRLLDEAIDLLSKAFAEEFPEHDGPRWPVRDRGLRPRPVQQPRPPIWVGGSTRGALRRAACRGDGWLPQGVPEMGMAAAIDFIRSEREKSRPGEAIDIGMNAPWLYIGEPSFDVGANALTGSADAIAVALRGRIPAGVTHVGVRFRSRTCDELIEQIGRFGAEIAPQLADAGR